MYSVTPVTAPIPLPPALVATPLPDTAGTLRVPPTDVAPSFSNEQVSNESKGTGNPRTRLAAAQPAALPEQTLVKSPSPTPSLAGSAQTNFLAQLISQDISPQATIYLAQYEKLVYFASVKYKPSNAGKPLPSGLYQKLLQADPQPAQNIVLSRVPDAIARVAQNNERPQAEAYDDAPQAALQPAIYTPDPSILAARAVYAYAQTAARNEILPARPEPAPRQDA